MEVSSSPYCDLPVDVRAVLFRSFPLDVLQKLARADRDHSQRVWAVQLSLRLDPSKTDRGGFGKPELLKLDLSRFKLLQNLTIEDRNVEYATTLSYLTNLRSLTVTLLPDNAPLASLTTLTHLETGRLPSAVRLEALCNLTHLDLRGVRSLEGVADKIPRLKKLKNLLLSVRIPFDEFEPICALDSLRMIAMPYAVDRGSPYRIKFEYFEMIHQYGNKILLLTQTGVTYWAALFASGVPPADILANMHKMYEKCGKSPSLDINTRSLSGLSILRTFFLLNREELIPLLLQHGADANDPLISSAQTGQPAGYPSIWQDGAYSELLPDGNLNSAPILPVLMSFFHKSWGRQTLELLWNATKDPNSCAISPLFAAILSNNKVARELVYDKVIAPLESPRFRLPAYLFRGGINGTRYTNALYETMAITFDADPLHDWLLDNIASFDIPLMKEIFCQIDPNGNNLLHKFCQNKAAFQRRDTIRFLINLGVDAWAVNASGKYPLDIYMQSPVKDTYIKEFGITPQRFWQCHREFEAWRHRPVSPFHEPTEFVHDEIIRIMWYRYIPGDLQEFIRDLATDIRNCPNATVRAEHLALVLSRATWEAFSFFAVSHTFRDFKSASDKAPARIAKETWIKPEDLALASKLVWNVLTPNELLSSKYFDELLIHFCSLMGAPLSKAEVVWERYLNPAELVRYDECVAAVKEWIVAGEPSSDAKLLRLLLDSGQYGLILHFMRDGGLSASGTDIALPDVTFPKNARYLPEYFDVILLLVQQGCDSNALFQDGKSLVERIMAFTPILDRSILPSFVKLGVKWPTGDLRLVKYAITNGAGAMELKYFLSEAKENQIDELGIWDELVGSARLGIPEFAVPLTCDLLAERRIIPNVHSMKNVRLDRIVVLERALPLLSDFHASDAEGSDFFAYRMFVTQALCKVIWREHKQKAAPLWKVFTSLRYHEPNGTSQLFFKASETLSFLAEQLLPGYRWIFAALFHYDYFEPLKENERYYEWSELYESIPKGDLQQYLNSFAIGPLPTTTTTPAASTPSSSSFGSTFSTPFAFGSTPAASSNFSETPLIGFASAFGAALPQAAPVVFGAAGTATKGEQTPQPEFFNPFSASSSGSGATPTPTSPTSATTTSSARPFAKRPAHLNRKK